MLSLILPQINLSRKKVTDQGVLQLNKGLDEATSIVDAASISVECTLLRANLTRVTSPPISTTGDFRLIFSVPFSYIFFSSFTFTGAPYRIFLLFLPWFPCHSYLVVIKQQQQTTCTKMYQNKEVPVSNLQIEFKKTAVIKSPSLRKKHVLPFRGVTLVTIWSRAC